MMIPKLLPAPLMDRETSTVGDSRPGGASRGPRLILLFTRDRAFDRVLADALLGQSAIVLIARSVGHALQIVCRRGRELDLAVLDFDDGCRGMTLLSAVHGCYDELPILVTSVTDEGHAESVAYANGARACLQKPFATPVLANAIATMCCSHRQELIAA